MADDYSPDTLFGPSAPQQPAAPAVTPEAKPPEPQPPKAAQSAYDPDTLFSAKPQEVATPKPTPSAAEDQTIPASMSEVGSRALSNLPSSTGKLISETVHPFIHPVETYENVRDLGHGVLQKLGIASGTEDTGKADAAGQYLVDRYGGWDNIKRTMANDPMGFMADASILLTGGGGLAARLPGAAGKAGEIAGVAGKVASPFYLPGKAVTGAGKAAAELIGDVGTFTGGESVRAAARAGYEGGEAAKAFRENLRGNVPTEDVVSYADKAIDAMKKKRGEEYVNAITPLKADQTVLSFNKVDDALRDILKVKTISGSIGVVPYATKTADIRNELSMAVEKWRNLPQDYHTLQGFDAFKQDIGDIYKAQPYGSPERKIAGQVYNAIGKTIREQAPEYSKIMTGYEQATEQVREIEKSLSLGEKASIDTGLRKLQSILRNNVSTNYGRRRELAQFLIDNGAPNLMEKLAGQAMRPWTARGLGKLGTQLGIEIAAATAGLGAGTGVLGAAALLPLMSPRLVGETAYYTGRAAKPVSRAALPSTMLGRMDQSQEDAYARARRFFPP